MKLSHLEKDNVSEKIEKTLQKKEKVILLNENNIQKSNFNSQKQYEDKKNKLYSKSCGECINKDPNSSYCNKTRTIIYDFDIFAFGCDDFIKDTNILN